MSGGKRRRVQKGGWYYSYRRSEVHPLTVKKKKKGSNPEKQKTLGRDRGKPEKYNKRYKKNRPGVVTVNQKTTNPAGGGRGGDQDKENEIGKKSRPGEPPNAAGKHGDAEGKGRRNG